MDGVSVAMIGERSYGPAKLTLSIPKSLPEHMRPRVRELTGLHVPIGHRGAGIGAELMHLVCSEADREGLALLLLVQPYDDNGLTDVDALSAWYERFGFETIQTKNVRVMGRRPVRSRWKVGAAIRAERQTRPTRWPN